MGVQQSQPGTSGGVQQSQASTNAAIAPGYVGPGEAGTNYAAMLGKEYGGIENNTTNRFEDMFSKYVDVANREAGRQASQIGESLGSRGALYSSANLQQQADLRQKTSQDIAAKGAEFQTTLEDQRQKALGQVFAGQAGVAQAEMGGREAAMARVFADFMRRSDVPPWANVIAQTGATRPSSGSYAV